MAQIVPLLNTPFQLISDAYFEAGKTARGESPSSEEYAYGMRRLNNLLNLIQADGLRLWLQFDLPITLTAGQNLYTLGPTGNVPMTKPTRVIEGYFEDTTPGIAANDVNRPLLPLSRNEWDNLSTFNAPGSVNSYFVDKQINTLNVYMWLTPDAQAATGFVHLVIQQQQPNVIQLTDQTMLGPEWFIYMTWELAQELSQGQPIAVQKKCQDNAMRYKAVVDGFDMEDTGTMFQPDYRMTMYNGGFR